MIRIVTVPLDLTAESDRAITPGVVLAQQLGAGLELVVVTSPGIDTGPDQYELQARAAQLVGVVTSTGVVEADDAYTGLHSRDVVRLSIAVAEVLELDEVAEAGASVEGLLPEEEPLVGRAAESSRMSATNESR